MKKNSVWEVLLRILIAAGTAALTALGTTSCMGHGPISF
ncbi:MAG: smalltalk protein [Prevotella sp.]|nr:smalltalk protein [Prevotella sp.]MBR3079712.1 smalltalk protein [Prevotella sp.]